MSVGLCKVNFACGGVAACCSKWGELLGSDGALDAKGMCHFSCTHAAHLLMQFLQWFSITQRSGMHISFSLEDVRGLQHLIFSWSLLREGAGHCTNPPSRWPDHSNMSAVTRRSTSLTRRSTASQAWYCLNTALILKQSLVYWILLPGESRRNLLGWKWEKQKYQGLKDKTLSFFLWESWVSCAEVKGESVLD